jgi:ElaB/YqjD/DUF883 family membrane-anchored ribosome-binding protein
MNAKRVDMDNVDLEYLKKEFNKFRDDLAGMKTKLGGNAAEVLDQMGSYLNGSGVSARLAALESELEYYADKVKGTGKQAVARVESEVTQRPIASIAIAFGVGVLVSQFFRRS